MRRILGYWAPVIAWVALIFFFSTDVFEPGEGGLTHRFTRAIQNAASLDHNAGGIGVPINFATRENLHLPPAGDIAVDRCQRCGSVVSLQAPHIQPRSPVGR